MIKEDFIQITTSRINWRYFNDKGYNCTFNQIINVKPSDLSDNSHYNITAICDSCGKETVIRYHKYIENYNRHNYYGCKECSSKKRELTSFDKFGTANPMQNEDIKEKVKNTNLERYNTTTTLLEPLTKLKIDETNLKLYGNKQPLASPIIRDKINKTVQETYNVSHYSKTEQFKQQYHLKWLEHLTDKLIEMNITNYNVLDDNTLNIYCDKCNDYYNITYKNLYQRLIIQKNCLCTICNPLDLKQSGKELKILDFIKENYNKQILEKDRTILNTKELDIYLPEQNLAIEFNGCYWHSDIHKDKMYHINKTLECNQKDIHLIHIWEDDYIYKLDIVKSILLNKLNKTSDKIYARNTNIKVLTDNKLIRDFLNTNHLQGFVGSKIKLGLYYNDELVSIMTFGDLRIHMGSKKCEGTYELLRFCNKLNTSVIGGASKLLKYFELNYKPNKLITYADLSWADGNLYDKLGFTFTHRTEPNYFYFKRDLIRLNRYNFRKDILVKNGFDKNKTEYEIMSEQGYYRIYDCGHNKYEKNYTI